MTRVAVAALLATLGLVVPSCTSTVPGTAQPGPPGATIALMDTGVFPTTAAPPFGNAGDEVDMYRILEAQRLAEFVTGPWESDALLHSRGSFLLNNAIGPQINAEILSLNEVLPGALPGIARTHNYFTGFSTQRLNETGSLGLRNVVMMFPDSASASAAAAEMEANYPAPSDASPPQRVVIASTPDAVAVTRDFADRATAHSFTVRGRYVLYQDAYVKTGEGAGRTPQRLIGALLARQTDAIDKFVPTDPAQFPDLPIDPSGKLLARTLWADDDNRAPSVIGTWQPGAWLHMEDNPVEAAAVFREEGVDAVTQRLSTVYQAENADAAARALAAFADAVATAPTVSPTDAVPGLPQARCFSRRSELPPDYAQALLRVEWTYKCLAQTDRYVFMTYSQTKADAMQQISAQYRILAGE